MNPGGLQKKKEVNDFDLSLRKGMDLKELDSTRTHWGGLKKKLRRNHRPHRVLGASKDALPFLRFVLMQEAFQGEKKELRGLSAGKMGEGM